MLGAFCAVTFNKLLGLERVVLDETQKTAWGTPVEIRTPYIEAWMGDFGRFLLDYSVPVSILIAIPVMLLIGIVMERGLIKYFYKRAARRPDSRYLRPGDRASGDHQALFLVPIRSRKAPLRSYPAAPTSAPGWGLRETSSIPGGAWSISLSPPRSSVRCSPSCNSPPTAWWCARGMRDSETVGLLGINIQRRFTVVFGIAAVVAGLAGVMYTPILPPDFHMGMDFLVLSFVVVVVGGMGSLPGAVLAGFLLGILQSFASMNEVKSIFPGIDQIIIYLVAVVILLTMPRGLLGREGVMED